MEVAEVRCERRNRKTWKECVDDEFLMTWKCMVYFLNGQHSGICGGISYGQVSNPSSGLKKGTFFQNKWWWWYHTTVDSSSFNVHDTDIYAQNYCTDNKLSVKWMYFWKSRCCVGYHNSQHSQAGSSLTSLDRMQYNARILSEQNLSLLSPVKQIDFLFLYCLSLFQYSRG